MSVWHFPRWSQANVSKAKFIAILGFQNVDPMFFAFEPGCKQRTTCAVCTVKDPQCSLNDISSCDRKVQMHNDGISAKLLY
jgi:hypothetical protein